MALLYTPKDVYPFQTTITAGQAVNFKVTINGAQCVAYRLYVKKVSDNSVVYDSTKVTSGSTLYDGDILSVPVTLSADNYYWHIWMYWDSTNYINSQYYSFIASSSPSIVFFPSVPATITTPSYTFVGQYTQAENVLVKYFNISLYNENNILLDTSGNVYSQNIRYQFGGLLDGSRYRVRITGVTQGNVSFDTGYSDFVVSYTVPISLTSPKATIDDYSAVTVDWGKIKSILGEIDETEYTSLVINGNFAGTTGWTWSPLNISVTATSNIATATIASGVSTTGFGSYDGISVVNGHKYYLRGDCKTSRSGWNISVYNQSAPAGRLSISVTGNDLWGTYSGIWSNTVTNSSGTIDIFYNGSMSNGTYSGLFRKILLVDLTATFGVGNEPAKDWCDSNIFIYDIIPTSYVSNWIYTGNTALHLTSGSVCTFTFDYGAPLTIHTLWSPDSIAFTGDIFEIRNTAGTDIIKFGYASGQFYLDNNGVKDNTDHVLTTNKYLLAIIFDGAYFTKYFREV